MSCAISKMTMIADLGAEDGVKYLLIEKSQIEFQRDLRCNFLKEQDINRTTIINKYKSLLGWKKELII